MMATNSPLDFYSYGANSQSRPMTIESVDQVYDVAYIHDEHIVDGGDSDTHGWVNCTIDGFEIDEEDDELDMVVEFPWGEKHRYGWSLDEISDGNLAELCDAYGYSLSEFERLAGNDAWVQIRYIEIDEDGEIDSGSRIKYYKAPFGPNYSKTRNNWKALLVGLMVFAAVMLVFLL
jgi:hypothetical protein